MIVAVYGSAHPKASDPLYQTAQDLGRRLALSGFTVMTGAYCGTMEAVSKGALEAGAKTIGVTCAEISAWRPGGANAWVEVEISTQTLTQRLDVLTRKADAVIALPGGIGTLCEIALALNLMTVAAVPHRPFVLLGSEWKNSFNAFLTENAAYISPADRELVQFAEKPAKAVALIKDYYKTVRN